MSLLRTTYIYLATCSCHFLHQKNKQSGSTIKNKKPPNLFNQIFAILRKLHFVLLYAHLLNVVVLTHRVVTNTIALTKKMQRLIMPIIFCIFVSPLISSIIPTNKEINTKQIKNIISTSSKYLIKNLLNLV